MSVHPRTVSSPPPLFVEELAPDPHKIFTSTSRAFLGEPTAKDGEGTPLCFGPQFSAGSLQSNNTQRSLQTSNSTRDCEAISVKSANTKVSKHSKASKVSKVSKKSIATIREAIANEIGDMNLDVAPSMMEAPTVIEGDKATSGTWRSFFTLALSARSGKRTGRYESSTIDVVLRDDSDELHGDGSSRWVLDPNRPFCRVWHVLTSIVVIYIIVALFIDVGFSWYKINIGLYIFNYFVDGYCWLDMMVSFNTGFVHGGHLIMDRKKIAKHYLEFWFWVDLLANVPWEGLFTIDKSNRKAVKFVKWLKLPRLLRLGRLRKLMKANARYLNMILIFCSILLCMHMGACFWVMIVDPCSAYYDEEPFDEWSYYHEVDDDLVAGHPRLGWECVQSNIFPVYTQALHVSAASLLGVDRAAFGGYISGGGWSSSLMDEVNTYAQHLFDSQESASQDPNAARVRALKLVLLRRRYPMSLANSLTTGLILQGSASGCSSQEGFNTQAEMNAYGLNYALPMDIFGTIMLLAGLYLQGSLFANLTKMILTRNPSETAFRQAHDEVKRELDQYGHSIPEAVQKRICKHFEFRWINQAYGPLQLLNADSLSHSLRSELALCLYKDSVSNVEFLQYAPVAILTRVCLNLQLQYYLVNDVIYRRGEPPTGFYFVEMGKVILTRKGDRLSFASNDDDIEEITARGHFGVGAVLAVIQDRPTYMPSVSGHESMALSSVPTYYGHCNRAVLNRKTAIASTVCRLLWMPLDTFHEICNDHPKFFADLTDLCGIEEETEQLMQIEEESGPVRASDGTSDHKYSLHTAGTLQMCQELSTEDDDHEASTVHLPSMPSRNSDFKTSTSLPDKRPSEASEDLMVKGMSMKSLGTGAYAGLKSLSTGTCRLPPVRKSTTQGFMSFDLESQVSELERAVEEQTKKLEKAMGLLQELLQAMPASNV